MPQATYPGASGEPPSSAPLFGLAPVGVYQADPVTRAAGGLLHHRFTLTCAWTDEGSLTRARRLGHRRFVLCGTLRRVTPPGRYPATRSLELGLSSGPDLLGPAII
jgi:hypothetical protein